MNNNTDRYVTTNRNIERYVKIKYKRRTYTTNRYDIGTTLCMTNVLISI